MTSSVARVVGVRFHKIVLALSFSMQPVCHGEDMMLLVVSYAIFPGLSLTTLS
jgi:hypothetical protein